MQKLSQVIAVEKGTKTRVNDRVTELYKAIQKPDLFNGFHKTYVPRKEGDEVFPPQSQKVQMVATDMLRQAAGQMSELFDITAAKDFANCEAKGDVVVDGATILEKAPATYLLFLEKQLTDFHTMLGKLPTLDPAESWAFDQNANLHKSETAKTIRTKKVQKGIVLHPPTIEHPAQTQLITEDENVGTWDQIKVSGAVPGQEKQRLLERVEKLLKAVKFAREEANTAVAPEKVIGERVFAWILKS